MNAITFSLVPVPEEIAAGRKVYRAYVKTNGTVAAVATVTASDPQTITCSFPTPPEPGTYALEVSCRNGNRISLAPAVARLKGIIVKGA